MSLDYSTLNEKLFQLTKSCIICQFNSNSPQQHKFQFYHIVPRASCSYDIIPSLPLSSKANTAILLAIDMLTGYIQLQPLKNKDCWRFNSGIPQCYLKTLRPSKNNFITFLPHWELTSWHVLLEPPGQSEAASTIFPSMAFMYSSDWSWEGKGRKNGTWYIGGSRAVVVLVLA